MRPSARSSEVDYRHTSSRPAWSELPSVVRAAVEEAAGGRVVEAAAAVTTGFTGSYAGRLRLADGREVFAKAGGPTMPHVVASLAREAAVLAALPPGIPAAVMVGHGAVDGWSVLVLEAVDAHMPGVPWIAVDVDAAHQAALAVAQHGTPCPPALATETLAEQLSLDLPPEPVVTRSVRSLASGPLAVWSSTSTLDLFDLALRGPELLGGRSLVHGDLRPDNLLVDRSGRAVLVDWNWVSVGPAWVDFAGLWPLMARDGIDVDALVRSSPLLRGVDPDAVDAFLSLVALYMLANLDGAVPPGCTPALRWHQRLMAEAFLGLLLQRRGGR